MCGEGPPGAQVGEEEAGWSDSMTTGGQAKGLAGGAPEGRTRLGCLVGVERLVPVGVQVQGRVERV